MRRLFYYFSLLLISPVLFFISCGPDIPQDQGPDYRAHTFYYNWYGNPKVDSTFYHWKHDILPHWSDTSWDHAGFFPGGEDIGANYYPELGCYSSRDPGLIHSHMRMLKQAGIGVLVLSWWGEGSFEDQSVADYLDIAAKYAIKVAFHFEPFYSSLDEFKTQLTYLHSSYLSHPSTFEHKGKPLIYVYDSYKLQASEWARLLDHKGDITVRGNDLDATFIGLWVKENEQEFFNQAGFDGFYTYFASTGFVYGSTPRNWPILAEYAAQNNLVFIPCAGPGYLDTRIRPWNTTNQKDRDGGNYYREMFKAAVASQPEYIGITSFNEWHEGTQIEPAVSKSTGGYAYEDYGDGIPNDFYLNLSMELIRMWKNDSAKSQKP